MQRPDLSGSSLTETRHCLIDQAANRIKSGGCLINQDPNWWKVYSRTRTITVHIDSRSYHPTFSFLNAYFIFLGVSPSVSLSIQPSLPPGVRCVEIMPGPTQVINNSTGVMQWDKTYVCWIRLSHTSTFLLNTWESGNISQSKACLSIRWTIQHAGHFWHHAA